MSITFYRLSADGKRWERPGWPSIPIGGSNAGALYATHIPGRVQIGLTADLPAANGNGPRPTWDEAMRDHIGSAAAPFVASRRLYGSQKWFDSSGWQNHLKICDDAGVVPAVSVRAPLGATGAGWADIRDGNRDGDLAAARAILRARTKPCLIAIEHEPHTSGYTLADYAAWRDMNIHAMAFFSGWDDTFTTYNPLNDVSSKSAFFWVLNGFTIASTYQAERDTILSPEMVRATNLSRSTAGIDLYDLPTKAAQRIYVRGQAWVDLLKAAGFKSMIVPEWGIDFNAAPDYLDCLQKWWAFLKKNKDFIGHAIAYDSVGSFETRFLPADYPPYPGNANTLDLGGNAASAAGLAYFVGTMLPESVI